MDTDASQFRILLAEDDPVSRDFLDAALRACGATVITCANGRAALALARSDAWDMLLLDHHLPDLTGTAVLAALNADPGDRSARPAAIATTATPDEDGDALRRAGFAEILPKPISIAALRAALRRYGWAAAVVVDDAAASRTCGSAEVVTRLRRLFAERELPALLSELDHCNGDFQHLLPTLHRLRAACGFCGTTSLTAAADALECVLMESNPDVIANALGEFRNAVLKTRDALRDRPDAPD